VIVTVQASAVSTTTTLAVSKTNPASGEQITLTATVHAADSSNPVGAVEFFDGGTSLGAPVPVSGGIASTQFSSTVPGPHSLTATFEPTNPNAFTGSTSDPVIVTVQAPAVTTTTSLAASNTNPANGEQITLTATVHANDTASNDAVGAVEFFDGATSLGAPVPVSGGIAMTQFGSTVAGPHSLTAKFEPTDPNVFAGSTSDPVIVMVQPKQAVVTTTSLAASNTNPASGQQITLTATVTAADGSSPVGSVQFFDGGTALGTPVAVSGGTATRQFSSTVPGQHSLTATFTPTDSNAFTGSTSNPVIVTVQAAALAITTTRLANAKANTAYTATLTATGGTPPYTWAITAGSLPPGMSLNASTGVISGTDFTQTGKFSFTVTVTDQAGATASKSLTLSVTGKIK
jgi:Bacterial Ig-like domain (group 3)